jgi:hypothetical protein
MDSLIMFRTRLMSAVLASVISSSLGLAPAASATEGDAAERGAAFSNSSRPAAPLARMPRSGALTRSHTRPAGSATALRYFTTVMDTT